MNIKNLMMSTIASLLSACVTTTTYDYPDGKKPEPGYVEYKHQSSSELHKGILGSKNLDFELGYRTVFGKRTDGTIINEKKINLPDVEVVMHPQFTSDDKVVAFLSEKGAVLASNKEAESSEGVLAVEGRMSSSQLKAVVHTPAFEKEIKKDDLSHIKAMYQSVFSMSKPYKSLVIVPAWKDSVQSEEMIKQLYELFFTEALAASKDSPDLNIKLFGSSKEQEDFMDAAWTALHDKLGLTPSKIVSSSNGPAALAVLSEGVGAVKLSQGSSTISGAATNLGDVRLMGVFAEENARNNQSTLMVGFPVGSHMVAVGTELGFENKELSYSAAKVLAMMSATESLKFSAAISSANEKISMLFNRLNRSGVMVELGAHYNEQISQDVSVSINGGLRGFYSNQLEMGWFGQVSLDIGSFKAATFVSSVDAGINFGVKY